MSKACRLRPKKLLGDWPRLLVNCQPCSVHSPIRGLSDTEVRTKHTTASSGQQIASHQVEVE